jgi:hypothetical protein
LHVRIHHALNFILCSSSQEIMPSSTRLSHLSELPAFSCNALLTDGSVTTSASPCRISSDREKPAKCYHFGSNYYNHQKILERTLHNQSEPQLLKISCDSWLVKSSRKTLHQVGSSPIIFMEHY